MPSSDDKKRRSRLHLTRQSPFADVERFCPRCLAKLEREVGLGGWLLPEIYHCNNCGYQGTLWLEPDEAGTGAEKE